MENIKFRSIKKSDFKDIKELINDAWAFDNYTKNTDSLLHLLSAFMRTALLNQNYNEVAVINGKVAGLICGKFTALGGFWKNIPHIPSLLYHGLLLSVKSNNERRLIKGFYEVHKSYEKLLSESKESFDGELEFFIVHSKYKGLGIGKQLFYNFTEYCKKNSVRNIYLFTDIKCNYGFYDHNGFTKQGAAPVEIDLYNDKLQFDVYMYSKNLF